MSASDVDESKLPLRERSRRDKLRRIREATEQLLHTRTLAEITMRDVARLAGIGEATLFRYVAVKEDLLLHVFGHRMEDFITSVEANPRFRPRSGATGRVVVNRVRELYRLRADFYLASPENVTDYVRIGLSTGNALGGLSVEHGDRFIHVVENLLRAGQQDGVIAGDWDAHTVAGNCHGLFIHEILRSPARHFPAGTFPQRIDERLRTQLEPLVRVPG
ncbi:TetR/AcrR family transcriptional regulator [Kineococcus sp. SYSU DK001]|uniref:TetR/AcrR family transcriptional regulator n=1 Tax=Kineococcus sp. SYSU DK001 TaxID=3383122 RepID=UPI003D7EF00D